MNAAASTMRRYFALIALVLVLSGCTSGTIKPTEEETKTIEEMQQQSEETLERTENLEVEIDLSDPAVAKCKEAIDRCNQLSLEGRSDFVFEPVQMQKFIEPDQYIEANQFFNNYKGYTQMSVMGELQLYDPDVSILNMPSPVVLAAGKYHVRDELWVERGNAGSPVVMPLVFICINGNTPINCF